ncbi:MAG TPA: VTT domain-containing protein [Acetobacteraceae bacterium]|nr:VTT domain-containing protein [Acetobacteraceae bacterium]
MNAAQSSLLVKLIKLFALFGGLTLAGFGSRLMMGGGALQRLEGLIGTGGLYSDALFILLATVLVALGLPRQIPAYIGGYVFGLWSGIGLAMLLQCAALATDFYWARLLARDWAARRVKGRAKRLDAALASQPFMATLTLRLMPVGSNVITNLLAGLSSVGFLPFLLGSALGFLPQTVIFALIGAGTKISHGGIVMAGVATFLASTVLGIILLRRHRALAAQP